MTTIPTTIPDADLLVLDEGKRRLAATTLGAWDEDATAWLRHNGVWLITTIESLRAVVARLTAERDEAVKARDHHENARREAADSAWDWMLEGESQRVRANRAEDERDAARSQNEQLRALLTESEQWIVTFRDELVDENRLDIDDRRAIRDFLARITTALNGASGPRLTIGAARQNPRWRAGGLWIELRGDGDDTGERWQMRGDPGLFDSHHADAFYQRSKRADGTWSDWSYSDVVDNDEACVLVDPLNGAKP